jgi:2'-5' RNA ligase
VIVPVPDLEPVVARHRSELDVAATWGVPAHVTVLHPFVAPESVDPVLLRRLQDAVAVVPAFDCSFASTEWFGDEVVWVRPEPDEPFRALIRAVRAAFPQCPPYAGRHGSEPVPHLTVGARPADASRLRAAGAAVQVDLPRSVRVSHAWLVQGTDAARSWRLVEELPLGPSHRGQP